MIAALGPTCVAAAGAMLAMRADDRGVQLLGAAAIAAVLLVSAAPAHADQSLTVADNASVECVASQTDLTRISLVGDAFASVSKMQPEHPLDDFSIVNEPTRGDIYVSLPGGFRPKLLSFFGTSKKGYVYKFACRIEAVEAQQIFLSNPGAADNRGAAELAAGDEEAPDIDETAVRLVQAMAHDEPAPGYRLERSALLPVTSGPLTVQLLAQYRSSMLTGRVIRIENTGKTPFTLSEAQVAPAGALAVAITEPQLGPRQVTTAYVVIRQEGPQS